MISPSGFAHPAWSLLHIYVDRPVNKCRPVLVLISISLSPVSTRWKTLDTTNCLFIGKAQVYGARGGIHGHSRKLRKMYPKLRRKVRHLTLICGARTKSPVTM